MARPGDTDTTVFDGDLQLLPGVKLKGYPGSNLVALTRWLANLKRLREEESERSREASRAAAAQFYQGKK